MSPNNNNNNDDNNDTRNNNGNSNKLSIIGERVFQIISPVLICLLYTCLLIRIMSLNTSQTPSLFERTWYSMGVTTRESEDSSITGNFIIVFSFLLIIVLITLIIMLVFYLEWHCCLIYYFYLPSFIIMAFLTPVIIKELLQSLNWFGLDLITLAVFTYNITVVGMISIFSIYVSVPLWLQQLYLIHNSCLLAVLIISNLPGWAPWMLLTFLVLWDLFAVLAPFGPLNLIVSMAEREGIVDMPGLVYSTEPMANNNNNNNNSNKHDNHTRDPNTPKDSRTMTNNDAKQAVGPSGGGGGKPQVPRPFPHGSQEFATSTPALTATSTTPTTTATTTPATTADTPESALSTRIKTIESDEMVLTAGAGAGATGRQSQLRPPPAAPLPPTNLAKMLDTRDEESKSTSKSKSSSLRNTNTTGARRNSFEEERGVTIGLGDFIFYAMLVGVISKGRQLRDYYAILASIDAILVGLIVTLFILAASRRILPALPVSIGLGMVVACLTMHFVPDFANRLAYEAIFV